MCARFALSDDVLISFVRFQIENGHRRVGRRSQRQVTMGDGKCQSFGSIQFLPRTISFQQVSAAGAERVESVDGQRAHHNAGSPPAAGFSFCIIFLKTMSI